MSPVAGERRRLRLLQMTALTSTADRFALPPLLVLIGADLHAPLAAVAAVASSYFLAYGVMQPVWGVVSDRIGRVRVMRVALLGGAVAGLGSALAPNLPVLYLTRVLAGACFAALQPAALVYVGDVWPAAERQRALSDVLAAASLGIGGATAGAGLLADAAGWRVVPAVTGAAGAVLAVALRRLPEPDRPARADGPARAVGQVLRGRWPRIVLGLALVEGAIVLGVLTYLAPAVAALGFSAGVAGLAAAGFGAGALAWSRVVRLLAGRRRAAVLAGTGGLLLVAGWAVPSVAVTLPTVVAAGLLLGGTWAFLHTTLQSWATQVAPGQRATMVALFAAALFLGSSAGTALGAAPAGSGAFGTIFRVALAVAVPFAVLATVARARYDRAG